VKSYPWFLSTRAYRPGVNSNAGSSLWSSYIFGIVIERKGQSDQERRESDSIALSPRSKHLLGAGHNNALMGRSNRICRVKDSGGVADTRSRMRAGDSASIRRT
jgi:hypothetical protein